MSEVDYQIAPGTKVLVTGATGFTGSNLTKKLVEMDLDVVAIARPTSNLSRFDGMPITWLKGDVADPELIDKAMTGVSYVFHMVTPFREAKAPDTQFYNVHVLSTQLLAKAALQQPDFKRFVHVSTIGIHGHVAEPPADETYRTEPGDIYQETKLEGEVWIKEFSQETGLPIAVVRPAGIYGPGDKRLFKIYKWASQGWMPLIGDGSNLLHFIHVDDLTDFFLVAATHPKAIGETFICGSEKAMAFKDMVELISEHYGVKVKFLQFPKAPLFFVGDILETLCRPFGIEPPIYRRRLAFYTKDRSFNTSKMRNMVGFSTQHPDKTGLQELAQWYLDQEWLSVK
ncbi:NAD-dependent epimerase/dehydratase family protein [Oscillatoria sp. CS-180]|uniref:NAD-dependent epimerase/dehydratase family protein n=1 Tax=Oscillatoria sp. CS-180 TaxID=3021720 RepID=UPI00232C65F6|nr:NAD-dependent epimerase/dehydratase family protein [Oscillatoria sp. CS-180]MDB9526590.1 NAD-dependent epimerase/dehydratase family protein [Oscillatoria sp. CS-180]